MKRSKMIKLILTIITVTSCNSYAERDICVAPAILDYQTKVEKCKKEGLNFEQCDGKYSLESELEKSQLECRKEIEK